MRRQASHAAGLGSVMSSLVMIEEEKEQEQINESLLEHIEKHAGSALDQAQMYIEDFQRSRIEPQPITHGALFF